MSRDTCDRYRASTSHDMLLNNRVTFNKCDQYWVSFNKCDQYWVSFNKCDQYWVKRLLWQRYILQYRQVPSQEVWGEVTKCIRIKYEQGHPIKYEQGHPIKYAQGHPIKYEQRNPIKYEQRHPIKYEQGHHPCPIKSKEYCKSQNREKTRICENKPKDPTSQTRINSTKSEKSVLNLSSHLKSPVTRTPTLSPPPTTHLPLSVVSACKAACDRSNPVAEELKQNKSNKDLNGNTINKYQNNKSLRHHKAHTQICPASTKQSPYEKQRLTKKPRRHQSKRKISADTRLKSSTKTQNTAEKITPLPCSNCSTTTVVYPCSCRSQVYCGTICQTRHWISVHQHDPEHQE